MSTDKPHLVDGGRVARAWRGSITPPAIAAAAT